MNSVETIKRNNEDSQNKWFSNVVGIKAIMLSE